MYVRRRTRKRDPKIYSRPTTRQDARISFHPEADFSGRRAANTHQNSMANSVRSAIAYIVYNELTIMRAPVGRETGRATFNIFTPTDMCVELKSRWEKDFKGSSEHLRFLLHKVRWLSGAPFGPSPFRVACSRNSCFIKLPRCSNTDPGFFLTR